LNQYPKAYLTGMPAIYKKDVAEEILEFNKKYLRESKLPREYELNSVKGIEYLKGRKFIEMIPTFHVFREIFRFDKRDRSISFRNAKNILKLRD